MCIINILSCTNHRLYILLRNNMQCTFTSLSQSKFLSFKSDFLDTEKFVQGGVILESMQGHLCQYGDGGNMLGLLEIILNYLLIIIIVEI